MKNHHVPRSYRRGKTRQLPRAIEAGAALVTLLVALCLSPVYMTAHAGPAARADCGAVAESGVAQVSAPSASIDGAVDAAMEGTRPALVFLHTESCGFCRAQGPIVEELEREYGESVDFVYVDLAREPQVVEGYEVTGVPTMLLLASGIGQDYISQEFVGFTEKQALSLGLDRLLAGTTTSPQERDDSPELPRGTSQTRSGSLNATEVSDRPANAPLGPVCGNGELEVEEECDDGNTIDGDGCSSRCITESVQVYLAPYVGDIDGSIDSDWYSFYDQLTQWHADNDIPTAFSFYPGTMDSTEFNEIIARMYLTEEIELVTKGESDDDGVSLDLMAYGEVKSVIKRWQETFVTEMEALGYSTVTPPLAYNQRLGKFTGDIRDAIHDLGFKIYFEQFVTEHGYIDSVPDMDVMQYTLPLTVSGHAGADEVFRQPSQVIEEILDFERDQLLYLDGVKVVSLMVHQQDFRDEETSSVLDLEKWETYTTILLQAKSDARIQLLRPMDIFNLRHPSVCGDGVVEDAEECDDGNLRGGDGCSPLCERERIVLLAMDDLQSTHLETVQEYVVQSCINGGVPLTLGVIPSRISEPFATTIGEWDQEPFVEIAQHDYSHDTNLVGKDYAFQYGYLKQGTDLMNSWGISPRSYVPASGQADDTTVRAVETLGFHTLYEGMPLGIAPGEEPLVIADQLHLCEGNAYGPDCNFKAYSTLEREIEAKIEQHGVALVMFHMQDFATASDSVDIEQVNALLELSDGLRQDGYTLMTVDQYYQYRTHGAIPISQYAFSARATSEHTSAPASRAEGAPDATLPGTCSEAADLSDHGYSWTPANWDVTATLTLDYATPVYATGYTIYGDRDMCWSKVWLANRATGKTVLAFEGNEQSCTTTHSVDGSFLADSIILLTCGWSWSATDAVQLSGSMLPMAPLGNETSQNGEEPDGGSGRDDEPVDDGVTEIAPGVIWQYAQQAEATAESPGFRTRYAVGKPASDGDCSTPPVSGEVWRKPSWDEADYITLTFPRMVYPTSVVVHGDYELCISGVWLSRGEDWYLAWKGLADKGSERDCEIQLDLGPLAFSTNRVRLETCDWRWSAVDAVQLRGTVDSFPRIDVLHPAQDAIVDLSEDNVEIRISTDVPSECEFSREQYFDFGDGETLATADGISHSYTLAQPRSADPVEVYYKCNSPGGLVNPYPVMHRFAFRDIDGPFLEVCNWFDCTRGAASISIDDGYHTTLEMVKATCREALEERGLRGTYYLAYTELYTDTDWQLWREMYNYGHEIGGHMGDCSYGRSQEDYTSDLRRNAGDLVARIGMQTGDLTTFAWPCGVTSEDYQEWAADHYLFERGYHINMIESANPADLQEIKSINSFGFGEAPPDYYLLADVAENHRGWVNYVYHDSCDNPEVMDYLLTEDLWIGTIGTVSKYIAERNSLSVQEVRQTPKGVEFYLTSPLDPEVFDEELSFRVYAGNETIDGIEANGQPVEFARFSIGDQEYVQFNLSPSQTATLLVSGLTTLPTRVAWSQSTNQHVTTGAIAGFAVLTTALLIAVRRKRSRRGRTEGNGR